MLQAIAILQLYIEEHWVEPPQYPKLPLSLLYHQTMSTLAGFNGLTASALAERILTLTPFADVSLEQYRHLLQYLREIEHIERLENGEIIIGPKAERMVHDYHFYATFETPVEYRVRHGSEEIGVIETLPEVGTTLRLAGYTWRVTDVQEEKRIVYVERSRGKKQMLWSGGNIEIHRRILQRMRQVLISNESYGYLQDRARERLQQARSSAAKSGCDKQVILDIAPQQSIILPWSGTKEVDTLALMLKHQGCTVQQVRSPYYMELPMSASEVAEQLHQLIETPPDAVSLANLLPPQSLRIGKFARFIPHDLLIDLVASDRIDVIGATQLIRDLIN